MTQNNPFDCPVIEENRELRKQENRTIQVLSWEFLFAIACNIIIGVWFIASSQGEQDVRLETHEVRIMRNEQMLSSMVQQQIDIAKMQEQLVQVKRGQDEIKSLLNQLQAQENMREQRK